MDLTEFRASIAADAPPSGLNLPLQTLWWEAKGDWKRAHECAQEDRTPSGSIVHAYLHRVEGDLSNAGGWYKRAGKNPSTAALDNEWEEIARALLK